MTTWIRVADSLWLGDTARPLRTEFDHVVTVADLPVRTDDGLRHRHFPPPRGDEETHRLLDTLTPWIQARWQAEKRLLVQSPGYTWAELVIAAFWVHLGANPDEAISSLRRARPQAMTEQLFRDHLRRWRTRA